MHGIIYKATNLINNKVYIGKTIKSLSNRKASHIFYAKNKLDNSYFHKAIRKYGPDNFSWEILCFIYEKEKLNLVEKLYIAIYRKMNICYNITDGGDGCFGFCPSKETRIKLSLARKGKKFTEEHKRKIAISKIGKKRTVNPNIKRKHTDETKEKLRKLRLGKKLSEETRKKISAGITGEKNPMFGKKRPDVTLRNINKKLRNEKI